MWAYTCAGIDMWAGTCVQAYTCVPAGECRHMRAGIDMWAGTCVQAYTCAGIDMWAFQ